MSVEVLALAIAALDSLRDGVQFVQDRKGARIALSLTIRRVVKGEESVLAFGRITNNAEAPVTITEVSLLINGVRSERVPIVTLKPFDPLLDGSSDIVEARLHNGYDVYETKGVKDLRVLDSELYLHSNQSATGWMYFPVSNGDTGAVDRAEVEVCVGDNLYIGSELRHFVDPRKSAS